MAKKTRATDALDAASVTFELRTYDYDPAAEHIGMQAAESLGVSPHLVVKTLMALVDGKPVCVMVPSDREVNMKKLAAALGGKSAQMMNPADAERATGYHVGGISPFGQRRKVPAAIDRAGCAPERIFLNAGQRGLQIHIRPADATAMLNATIAELT